MDRPQYYCCLYHFTNGKQAKASTPCNHHVPLGVINPLPSTVARVRPPPPEPMEAPTQPRQPHYHTHDLNEIENKMSLPKRLAYPRVYVEKLTSKGGQKINSLAVHQAFLKRKDFQEVFLLFRLLARKSNFSNQTELAKNIAAFAKKNDIPQQLIGQPPTQYYFNRHQFVNYLIELGFQDKQALSMWSIAFNQARFPVPASDLPLKSKLEVVSMRAFVYNYKKFYLEEMQSYKNCLSEPALRQRMIDLRLFLEPWFNRNIIFKENHMKWQEIELEFCSQLKRLGQDDLSTKLLTEVQLRNRTWLFMRTLAKLIYQVTDQKNIGLQIFNQRATSFIAKNTINLDNFLRLVQTFKEAFLSTGKTRQDLFPVTDLLQFAKGRFPEMLSSLMVCMRGIFKYLYFFGKAQQLVLNKETLNLDCSELLLINCIMLQEFMSFRRGQTDRLMEMVGSLCDQINDVVDTRPYITGHKAFLNQCNFLAEACLKLVKRCDFTVFYRLHQARQMFMEGDETNFGRLRVILDDDDYQQLEKREAFWKTLFEFEVEEVTSVAEGEVQEEAVGKNYEQALGAYQQLRKKFQGKLPSNIKNSQSIFNTEQKQEQPSKLTRGIKSKAQQSQISELQQQQLIKQEQKHTCFNSAYCSLCNSICNTSVTSTLNKVDQMSSYLTDLLRDI